MKIAINKEVLKRASTYINAASAVVASLMGLAGVLPPDAMVYIIGANSLLAVAQAVSIQLGKVVV